MFSNTKQFAGATLIVACLSVIALAGDRRTPGPACTSGPGCVPARITYGYYPTTWRRWPTARQGSSKPDPEQLPTPAKAPKDAKPSTEEDSAPKPPTDTQTPPAETPSTPREEMKGPAAEPETPLPLPFEEPLDAQPDTKPKEEPGTPPLLDSTAPTESPADPTPTEGPPEPPKGDDEVPTGGKSLEDDPFKDEPAKDDDAPVPPAKSGQRQPRVEKSLGKNETNQWRVINRTPNTVAQKASFKRATSSDEPRRLQQLDVDAGLESGPSLIQVDANAASSPVDRSVKSPNAISGNPLRSASAGTGTDRVLPTASWTAVQPSSETSTNGGWRANPLRGN
jgi:hypothetical protein